MPNPSTMAMDEEWKREPISEELVFTVHLSNKERKAVITGLKLLKEACIFKLTADALDQLIERVDGGE